MSAQYMVQRMLAMMDQCKAYETRLKELTAENEGLRRQLDAQLEHEFALDSRRGRLEGHHSHAEHAKGQAE